MDAEVNMGILDHWKEDLEQKCPRCEGEDWLSPKEAKDALKDLEPLFMYLSIHGYTKPIPSIVRLVQHLTAKAGLEYDQDDVFKAGRSDEVKSATK